MRYFVDVELQVEHSKLNLIKCVKNKGDKSGTPKLYHICAI